MLLESRSLPVLALLCLLGCGEETPEPAEPTPAVEPAPHLPEAPPPPPEPVAEVIDLDEIEPDPVLEAQVAAEREAQADAVAEVEPKAEPVKPRPRKPTNAIQLGGGGGDDAAARAAAQKALAAQEQKAKEEARKRREAEEAEERESRVRRRVSEADDAEPVEVEVKETPEEREARLKAEAEAAEKARLARELWDKRQAEIEAKKQEEEAAREAAYQKASLEYERKKAEREEAMRRELNPDCLPYEISERAKKGELSDKERVCLEISVQTIARRDDRELMSSVLIDDAYARDDRAKWAELSTRHLEEINPQDAGLSYRMALHSWAGSTGDPATTLMYVESALENRAIWTGEVYDKRVGELLGLRAAASQRLWRQMVDAAEQMDPEDAKRASRNARRRTFEAALEWYAFASDRGQPANSALKLCELASERDGACLVQ